ncbi:MAG: tRNA (cytidine(34)-2'-O)-methyltransferase [Gemmatimonadota bacterium]|nr:tRNA (cytidine(34)-2'-O)-methyltransferase [Gemmatimonadota bacterium]
MTLHIALIEPRIPPNTGNIARLCVATDTPLHLIEPLGFSLDDSAVKRAGLDYWDRVDLWTHPNWFRFRDAISRDRCLYFSANAEQDYTEAPFRPNSVLVFGNETDGMPAKILEKHPELCYRIPMQGTMRNLNLANAVSVVLYEGLRQLGLKAPARMTFADTDVPRSVDADLEEDAEEEVNGNVAGGPDTARGRATAPPVLAGPKRRGRGRGRGAAGGRGPGVPGRGGAGGGGGRGPGGSGGRRKPV